MGRNIVMALMTVLFFLIASFVIVASKRPASPSAATVPTLAACHAGDVLYAIDEKRFYECNEARKWQRIPDAATATSLHDCDGGWDK